MKGYVNGDRIRIKTINSRRIDDIRPGTFGTKVTPAAIMVRSKPTNILEKMRTRILRNLVPEDAWQIFSWRMKSKIFLKAIQLLNSLAINVNLPVVEPRKPFYLLHDASFRAVTPIEEGRNDG